MAAYLVGRYQWRELRARERALPQGYRVIANKVFPHNSLTSNKSFEEDFWSWKIERGIVLTCNSSHY